MSAETREFYGRMAGTLVALKNCERTGNEECIAKHAATLTAMLDKMPSGAGWDHGTSLDQEKSMPHGKPERLVFHGSFHHMNEHGFYDGWTDHTITITPTFDDIDVKVSGRNRNDIKDYLADMFATVADSMLDAPRLHPAKSVLRGKASK